MSEMHLDANGIQIVLYHMAQARTQMEARLEVLCMQVANGDARSMVHATAKLVDLGVTDFAVSALFQRLVGVDTGRLGRLDGSFDVLFERLICPSAGEPRSLSEPETARLVITLLSTFCKPHGDDILDLVLISERFSHQIKQLVQEVTAKPTEEPVCPKTSIDPTAPLI